MVQSTSSPPENLREYSIVSDEKFRALKIIIAIERLYLVAKHHSLSCSDAYVSES